MKIFLPVFPARSGYFFPVGMDAKILDGVCPIKNFHSPNLLPLRAGD
jgi:hypothetical protein